MQPGWKLIDLSRRFSLSIAVNYRRGNQARDRLQTPGEVRAWHSQNVEVCRQLEAALENVDFL